MKQIILIIAIFILLLGFSSPVRSERYFAEIDNNIVTRVIVASDAGWAHKHLGGNWVETFMDKENDPINAKNYCGKGYIYIANKNNFQAPKSYPSWRVNAKDRWESPIEMPKDGKQYIWSEQEGNWKESL